MFKPCDVAVGHGIAIGVVKFARRCLIKRFSMVRVDLPPPDTPVNAHKHAKGEVNVNGF